MKKRNPKLEDALAALRSDSLDATSEAAAGERAWKNIEQALGEVETDVAHIRSCQDVRLLLPALRAGHLSPSRKLLVEDHLRDCVGCRRYAHGENADAGGAAWQPQTPAVAAWNWRGLAVAAMIIAVAAVTTFGLLGYFATPAGARATLQSAEGIVYKVTATGSQQLRPGAQLAEGEIIRTASGGHAYVKLLDGSIVELSERTELGVSAQRRDTTILLDGGRVIVQAAKRTSGHLYVKARDMKVAVTGTVFSVNSGLKGSRVAVIEGAVQVATAAGDTVLQSGQQTDTAGSGDYVPVAEEISWSQDLDKHLALLAEFAKLANKIDQNVTVPGPRYQSAILPLLPTDTLFYVSIPNLGEALGQANQIFQQQLLESPVLQQWWSQTHTPEKQAAFSDMIERVRLLSQFLGDEVVVDGFGGTGPGAGMAMIAKVKGTGLRDFLDAEAQKLNAQSQTGDKMVVLDPQQLAGMTATTDSKQLLVLVRPDYLVASPTVVGLQRVNAQLDAGASGFAGSEFGTAIQNSYTKGAGILIAANIQEMHARSTTPPSPALNAMGFANAHFLILEHRMENGQTQNRASVDFNGPRTGFASWLAAPAPIRSLEFVSPDASIVFAGVSKEPVAIFDDMMAMAQAHNTASGTQQDPVHDMQEKLGVNLRDEVAASLGGDVAVALDGPPLPTPSWKAVIEVTNSTQLESALERMIAAVNLQLAANSKPQIVFTKDESVTPAAYSITYPGSPQQMNYTFADGYMIVGPTRAMVLQALQIHDSGVTLASSQTFHAMLPQDGQPDVSALFYQNLSPILQPLSSTLTSSQMQSLQEIAANSKPTVVVAYGAANSIQVASTARFPGMNINAATFGALLGFGKRNGTIVPQNP